jgi:hypothetical protein
MTISFLFFHFFLSLLYPPVLPLRPCPSCSAIPPASQPYAPHNPPPPPSPKARARALPSPADLAALWIPPLPALARRRYAERWQSGGGPHGSMCGDDGLHRGSSSGGDESGSRRANQAPGVANRVPVGSGAMGVEETASASSGRRPPDGRELVPRRRRRPSPRRWRCSIAGRSRRGAWGRDRVRRRPTDADRSSGGGAVGAPRTGASAAAGRPGRRLQEVAGGSNGSNRGVETPFSTCRRRGRRGGLGRE